MTRKTTVLVTGDVRRAAAAINGVAIQCRENADDDLEGSAQVDVSTGELKIGLTVFGAPGTKFSTKFTVDGEGSIEKGSRMKTDVAIRPYTIKLSDLES
jgi:hypothetical protein